MRQAITQRVIRMAIAATARVPAGTQSAVARRTVLLGGGIPVLRRRVLASMRLALGQDVPEEAAGRYFEHAGWFLANALATFHHGVERTPVIDDVDLGPTVSVLDEAIAEGRGVVLTSPHWSGHELIGGVIARRHPMVMLVRQASAAERAARKQHWYRALGAETVIRPEHASAINDAAAYLKVLKQRKVLGITPDLLASAGRGVEISLFGRSAWVHGGAFAIAIATGAPLIRFCLAWRPDGTVTLTFEKAPSPPPGVGRHAAVQASAQEWFRWFEDRLRLSPENWLFWLDRRWSRFLAETPRAPAK
jgi:lauroyl/myristoyl acyltransferase